MLTGVYNGNSLDIEINVLYFPQSVIIDDLFESVQYVTSYGQTY